MKEEKTIDTHDVSYSQLFSIIGEGNTVHVRLGPYSKATLRKECCIQNRYIHFGKVKNKKLQPRPKFSTTTSLKEGYLSITQNW